MDDHIPAIGDRYRFASGTFVSVRRVVDGVALCDRVDAGGWPLSEMPDECGVPFRVEFLQRRCVRVQRIPAEV